MNNRTLVIAGLAVSGMVYAFYSFTKTPVDPTSLNIIFTICSGALSWVISDYFASESNTLRIDGVGERSAEKILNQSLQLWEIEQSLIRQAEEVEDYYASRELIAAQEKIQLIRSSNNTFIGDWEGVVSDPVQQKMAQRNDELNERFRASASPSTSEQPPATNLPAHLTPRSPIASKLTTVIDQEMRTNNEKKSQGVIRVRLNRDTYKFNFTGRLDPNLESVPSDLRARLIHRPQNAPQNVSIHVNTGTTLDFHVHARSNDYGITMPAGEYVFEYIVQTEDPNAHQFQEAPPQPTEPVNEVEADSAAS